MKRVILLAIWVTQLAMCASDGQAASADPSAPFDLPGYTTELGRWSESASRLREHPEEATALRQQLPDHWAVTVEEQRFLVPTQWLGADLDRLAANPKLATDTSQEICVRLNSMLQDTRSLARISEPNSSLARAKLDDILKRHEFRNVRAPSREESIWDQITAWVWKLIDSLLNHAGNHPAMTKVLLWGVVIALGLVFLGWLIYSLANLSLAKLSFRRSPPPVDSPPAGTWREWVQQARGAAARGDYRDAVRIIYGAAVRRIEEGGTWQVDPSRTHREYVRLLAADSLQRPPLVAITTCFERVWYGHASASAVDYEVVLAELESLG